MGGGLKPMGPLIRTASLRGFAQLVSDLGGDPSRLLLRFGLPVDALSSDDAMVPITAHDLMLDAAARELDCPDFGLRLAEAQDLTILGPLALAIESSATVAEALQCASRFLFVHSPALRIGIEDDPFGSRGVVCITYRKDLAESTYSPQAIELGLGLLHHVTFALVGSSAGLRSVLLSHQPIAPRSRYLEFFGVDVRFGTTVAGLRVERRLLDADFAGTDVLIRQVVTEHLASHYPDPATLVSVRVRAILAEGLGVQTPSLARTARLLSLHPRTLQRRLAAEGTHLDSILDTVRREAAHRYLTTTDLPLGQVTAMVGFAEQSSLAHAVRRWFGVSPRELRRASPVGD